MIDLLEQSAAWLDDQRQRYLTRTVVYQRGQNTVELQATVGQTVFRIDDGYGGSVRFVQRDYLIRGEDLVLAGDEVIPQRGDRIRETKDSKVFVHEVMGPGSGEPDWRYSGPNRSTLRIHTKHVATEDA